MKTGTIIIFGMCFLILSGCTKPGMTFKDYGKIVFNSKIKKYFEENKIDFELRYYISGSENYPSAIIGIDRKYRLKTSLWKERSLTPESLRHMVNLMNTRADEVGLHLLGFDILDDTGTDIGDWYSVRDAKTSVRIGENREVYVAIPPPDVYEREFRIPLFTDD